MNFKMTGALILIAIVAVVVWRLDPFEPEVVKEARSPWFYQVSEDDIETIKINYKGSVVSFYKTGQSTWDVEHSDARPRVNVPWGRIALLPS